LTHQKIQMNFDIFAYNFPHWKTHEGLRVIDCLGLKPKTVILAPKKVLNIPQSKRRLTPDAEYHPHPQGTLKQMGWDYVVQPHEQERKTEADFAVILGARILPKKIIDQYPYGIVNIHPGILPGNRGLDNLKWAIVHKLPIGATAHFIDSKIDMGRKIAFCRANIKRGTNLFNVYEKLREAELSALLVAISLIMQSGLRPNDCPPIPYTPKYSALPDYLDENLPDYWEAYKASKLKSIRNYEHESIS